MYPRLLAVNGAVVTLEEEGHSSLWHSTLERMADQRQLHGLIAGRCCRILFDQGLLNAEEASTKVGLALSHAGEPERAARWVDGFLPGSGLVLLHNSNVGYVVFTIRLTEEETRELNNFADRVTARARQSLKESL